MRSGRSFLVLLALAAGLGAYIYFVELDRETSVTPAKAKVFDQSPGLIEEIEVKAEGGEVTRIKREGSTWRITAPAGVEGDTAQIATLVTTIDSLEAERTVDENPASVTAYGLEPPRFTVAFRKEGETDMRTLQVGGKTLTGADVYARVLGQTKVVLIAGYLEASLNRKTFDLRDKAALKFTRDAVTSLELTAGGMPARGLVKAGDEWRLTAPVAARADFSAVDGLIGQLFQLQMKSVVTEDGTANLKAYGLDKPQATAVIGAGSSRATIAIGSKLEDSTSIHARDLSRPMVFTVEATTLDDLKRDADTLRLKDLFAFRSFNAVSLTVTWNGQTATFAKVAPPAPAEGTPADPAAAPPSEIWKRTSPDSADVDQAKLSDLLSNISNLRAESFADRALAAGDELTVVARFGDAGAPTEERVTFRRSGDVAHAMVPGEPGAALVRTVDFDAAVTALKALAGFK